MISSFEDVDARRFRYVEDVLQLIGDVGLSPFAGKMT